MKKLFKDLDVGDFFEYHNMIYVKTEDIEVYEGIEVWTNCVILSKKNPGAHACLNEEQEVKHLYSMCIKGVVMNILMLEDSEDRIVMIQRQCEKRWNLTVVNTVEEFQRLASTNLYDVMLFDHDLGTRLTGMDAVNLIVRGEVGRPGVAYIHSANCVTAPKMVTCLREIGVTAYQIDFLSLYEGLKNPNWEF